MAGQFDKFKFWKPHDEINPSADIMSQVDAEEDHGGLEVTIDQEIENTDGVGTSFIYPGADSVHSYLAAPVSTNKLVRLTEYRSMSHHVEVSDAIDEIADSVYNIDESGLFAKLKFSDEKRFSETQKDVLNKEFQRFVQLFEFEENTFNYARTFIIEGELTFENIIDPKNPTKGILAVKLLSNDKYELLKDIRTGDLIGIFFDVAREDANSILHADYGTSMNFFREIDANSQAGAYTRAFNDDKKIPLLFSQITYINTGIFDNRKTFVYPPLHKSLQAYRQLILIEDGVIIYRVARSPERLVFNIASGNISGQKAQQSLLQMVKRFNMRKATRSNTDGTKGISNTYDSHQVVESFWFLKPENGEGSSVESIGGTSDFGELEDLKFFTRKLYRSLKVPFSRFEQPENTVSKGEDITYEEYKFAKFVTRHQQAFASGLYESFKTHLKLKKLWEKYGINIHDMRVALTVPALYELYQTAKLNELKMDAYSSIADNENFSYTLAQKKILQWSDDDVKVNEEHLDLENDKVAEREYWAEKIAEFGSRELAEKAIKAGEDEDSDDEDGKDDGFKRFEN